MLEPRTAEFHLDWTCRSHLSRASPRFNSTGRVEVASAERRRARSRRDVSKSARPGIAEFRVGWGMLEPRTAEFHLDWTCRSHLSRASPSFNSTGRVEVASAERRRARSRRDVSKSARPGIAEFHVGWGVLDLSAAEFHLDRTCGSRLRRASPSSISSGLASAERRRARSRRDVSKSARPGIAEFRVGWGMLEPRTAEFHLDRTCGSRLRRASPSSISSGRIEVGSTGHRRVPRRLGMLEPRTAEFHLDWTCHNHLSRAPPSSISTGRVEVASAERRRARSRRDVSKSARPGIAEFHVGWGMLEPRTAEFHLDWTCRSHLSRASPRSNSTGRVEVASAERRRARSRRDVSKSARPGIAEFRVGWGMLEPRTAEFHLDWTCRNHLSRAPPSSISTGRVEVASAERRRARSRRDVSKSARPGIAEFHVGWGVLDLSAAEFHLDRTCGSRLRRASPSSISSGRIEVGSTGHRRVPRRLGHAGASHRRVPSRPDVWKSPPPSVAELDLVGTYRSRLDRASPSSTSAGACWI
ncbi:putative trans-sialidase, Group IV [Phytophthora cinnamomi]|nr:putative trans-sialidase, Group IV [Phytophthora cinnamomi]